MESVINIKTISENINQVFDDDPRVKEVFLLVKEKYREHVSVNHGWRHIISDLFRAMLIAASQKKINYSILIPAVMFHDIGYLTDPANHEKEGGQFVRRSLPRYGFNQVEIELIVQAIEAHSHYETSAVSLEAKILYDADKLERASPIGIFLYFLDWLDKGGDVVDFFAQVSNRLMIRTPEKDLHLPISRELCSDGFVQTAQLAQQISQWAKKRPDAFIKPEAIDIDSGSSPE